MHEKETQQAKATGFQISTNKGDAHHLIIEGKSLIGSLTINSLGVTLKDSPKRNTHP
jgi:hypothetical protein